ncbi:MAG TPA: helix-turn-helix domain-containing protein [Pyrinomonadaceae bacterium]|nr:helix-turn-helix domain-containing protein [Pyrinomonadaceae bacterium]
MGTITLNEKQRRRCEIITRLIAKKISNNEASELLDRSRRQMRRMRQRYEAQGLETLIHGNQGRPSPRRTQPALIEQLRELAGPTGRYHDFNVSHLAEMLARDDQDSPIHTVTPAHYSSHSPAPTCQAAVKRMQRERKSAEGLMLQTDASPHDWLDRYPLTME